MYAARNLRILDKDAHIVPFRWNAAQRHFHARRTGRDLILKARQLGFSTYIQGEIFRRITTGTRTAMTMAHDDETTQKMRRMADRFWENHAGEQPKRKYANAAVTTYPEFDSEATIATAGGKQKGRGGTYTEFHGSEVAFWPDAEKIVAGALQGGTPDTILESTPNGAQGYFYELCQEAIAGEGAWKLHFYPWWWDAAYRTPLDAGERIEYTADEAELVALHNLTPEQIKWRRGKQTDLKAFFPQEYPEDPASCFLTSGNSYFGNIAHVFTAPLTVAPVAGRRYAAGLDFGQTVDFTVLIVIDAVTKQMVAMLRVNRLEWGEMRRRIVEVCKRWGVSSLLAEANSIGSVNIEELRKNGLAVTSFETSNDSKATIMSDLHEGFRTGGLQLQNHAELRQELNTFVSSQTPSGAWRLAAQEGAHDDTVMALALAWQAVARPTWYIAGM